MAGQRVEQKWRPPLSWIVFAVLLAVLSLPVAIVIWFGMLDEATSGVEPVEVAALVVALVITLVIAGLFTRTITGPINALIRTTEAIGRGGSLPVSPPAQHGTRELAVLSQSFLDLAERLVERTDYVHSFAAHVSHELKSPLTAIRGSAELLLDDSMSAADRQRFARNIIADSDRLAVLLERLRVLARTEVPLDAKGVTAARAAELLRNRFPDLGIATAGAIDRSMALSEEAALIVLTHLADNAVQHGATELTIAAAGGEGTVHLRVADNGAGIAKGNRARVFEPFFTTRREQGGTGLGLEIARSMLQAHGGSIDLAPSERGAAFDIVVPLWVPGRRG